MQPHARAFAHFSRSNWSIYSGSVASRRLQVVYDCLLFICFNYFFTFCSYPLWRIPEILHPMSMRYVPLFSVLDWEIFFCCFAAQRWPIWCQTTLYSLLAFVRASTYSQCSVVWFVTWFVDFELLCWRICHMVCGFWAIVLADLSHGLWILSYCVGGFVTWFALQEVVEYQIL